MYLIYLISIDLELSRLFNSPTLHCYKDSPLGYPINLKEINLS